ncbi:MAG: PQQ-binding-like beta-propeller repeat protein [Chthoniobacteraceae bacterium]
MPRVLLFALLLVCSFRIASAAIVELRLVPFDKPDLTVDKLEKERPITNPVTTAHGMEMQKIGVDYTGWARNIFLDGKPVFERYYQGKYIDRLPVARPDLSPGDHTIWPGNHVFTVTADGSITSKSPELIISAGVVKIKCYPVTLRAYIANPDEAELPLSMRITPLPNLTLRDSANAEENAPKRSGGQDNALELLPVFDKFAPLTLWLPANTEGKGYLVHPVGLTFQLSAAGISAGAGGGQTVKGLHVEQNIIEIPLFSYPITGDGNTKAVITGMEQLTWQESENGETKSLVLYPRRDPFEFLITKPGPSLLLNSDTLPFKSLRVDIPDPATGNQRAIAVEMASRHFEPGGTAEARVRALDAMPAQTANHAAAMAHAAVASSARALQAAQAGLTQAEQAAKAAQEKETAAAFAVEPVRLKGAADAAKLAAVKQRVADATQAADAAKKSVDDAALAGDQAKIELLAATDSAANAKKEASAAAKANPTGGMQNDAAAKVVTLADEAVAAAKQKSAAAAKAAKPLQNAMKAATAALNSASTDLAKTESDIATAPPPIDPVGADLDEAKSELESAKAATVETVKALEAAKVALATAEQSAQTAAAAEDAAARQIDANSALNPLEKAQPYAQLMPYEGKDWQDLKTQAGADGNVTITLPAVSTGLYRLRLGVHEGNGRPLFADQWISIAAPQPVGVGLFTQRGRNAFFRGEPFWVGLSVLAKESLPSGEALEVDLVDEHGVRLPMLRDKAPLITKQGTFIIRLDGAQTLSLAAGHYHVEAKVGSQAAAPLALEMVEPEPRTHFTNLLNGKYNVIGGGKGELSYMKSIKTGQGSEQLASEITGMGYNAFMGMCYDMSRVHRNGLDLEQVVRECPELGPWESYYQPSGRDRFLNAAVRQNLRFYEDLFTEHDAMLPRDPQILDACERYSSLETASMHFSPAFRGVCLYDELYDTGDNDAPRSVVAAFFQGQEMSYRAKYPGMTSADATKALDRFTGRPFGERKYEDLAKFRTWAAHQDSDWQVFSERMAGAVKAVDPSSQNWTLYRAGGNNGANLSGNGVPEDVFSSLDVASTVMYKDGGSGDRPVFAPMMANILHLRDGLPVWTQIHNYHASGLYGAHLFRQAVFGLSQKIDGLTYFTIEHDPYAPDPLDNRDTVRNIAGGLLTPYGDFLSSLDRGYHKVAVFYSRESAQLGVRKVNKLNYTAEGLWVSCLRAGFPADFLYDRQLREGKGMDYDVIFAPGYAYEDEASPEILAALKRLVAAGKTVVVEKSSKLPIEGIVRLDSELDEFDDKLGGSFPRYIDFESEMVWDQTEQTTKLVRGFLSKITKPAAEHNLIVGPDWLKRGQGEYMVLADFAPVKFSGLYKTLYQAPDQPTLRFPRRPPACYDVLEMRPVDVKTDGDWMTLQADMRHLPGKIFAFLPSAIDKVSLKAAATLPAGTDLNFQASVVNAAGEMIDAAFPVEITLLDPSGKTCLQIFRSAAPLFQSAWRVPLNAPPGQWKLRVRELISGAVTETGVDVTTPATLSLDAKLDTSPVWVHDGQRIKEFLTGTTETSTPAKAGAAVHPPEILIALDEEQPWCRPQAEKLAAALVARGRAAKVVNVSDVLRIPNDWGQTPVLDGGRLWRGELVDPGLAVDAPLILLGHRYENRLIEALARRDVLPEVISTHFPAPGKAVVGWTRRAFSNFYDTVSVLANDDAGMAAGIAEMLHADGSAPLPATVQPAFQASAVLTPASASSNAPTSLRDTLSGEDRIRTLDVDPATGRILVGTFGFGHNLFCFGPDGKLLWKQFLPEHNVYFAHWCDGGKSVVAATGQGFFLFLLNGTDGSVFKKLAATEWPLYHVTYGQGLEGAVNTELQIAVNEPLREIIVRGQTGLMALDFGGRKLWFHDRAAAIAAYPKDAEQSVAATFGQTVHVGNFALSPDGVRVVYSEEMIAGSTPGVKPGAVDSLFKHTPEILDARTGRVLLRNEEDPGNQREAGNWSVSWPSGSATPRVQTMGLSASLRDDNTLGSYTPDAGLTLKDGGTLKATRTTLARIAADGSTLWQVGGDTIWLSALDVMNAGQTRFFRCDREGLVRCFEVATGRVLWDFKLPFNAVLHAVGDELVAGANNGALVRLDATGKLVWQTRLRDHHEVPGADYGAYVAAARLRDVDSTPEFFPSGIDGPDDYKGILRMGIEQLANGDFESPQDWTIEKGTVHVGAPAKTGKSALQLDMGQLATQRLVNRVIPSATYLLEFWYRVEDTKTKLVAGGMLDGTKQTLTASTFSGRPGEWTFGRVAVKSYADTRTLDVGFEADGGHVSVDAASLRAVRFPSANLLANTELNAVDPTYVKDIRVQFDRIPSQLRDRLMSRNRVSAFAQGLTAMSMIYTQEAAFLQNGKLDDVGGTWTYAPDPIAFAVTLTKPSYISHLVLYLNNATPDSVYQTISILANNLETKTPQDAALVRMNKRRFVVVNFNPPLFTDALKIIPAYYRAHTDSLTEIELYGPLDGGKIAGKSGQDSDAVPMLMGTPSRVPARLPTDMVGAWHEFPGLPHNLPPTFASGSTVVDGMFSYGDPNGAIRSVFVPDSLTGNTKTDRMQLGPQWTLATVTPTSTPARYKARLLVGSADFKLHAVADNGTYLWSFATGGRVYSSPVPDGDDVFFGSDDGHLYKVDVDSGVLIWEFITGDKIRGAPALSSGRVFVASWDGFLYAVESDSGRLAWKMPIAKFTRATPAVQGNKVFIGDEGGAMHCFDMATGRELWQQQLGGYISACPVVTPEGVAFASEQGAMAFMNPDGTVKWKHSPGAGISGQPIATQTQLLVPTEKGLLVLRRADGEPDGRFTGPESVNKVLNVLKWRDQLFVQTAYGRTEFNYPPRTYAEFVNNAVVWLPGPAKPKEVK